jgi:hypothetical protein
VSAPVIWLLMALSVVAAAAAAFAAVWARSAARKVDDFAGIVIPYLKDAPAAAVIAAAAAAPEPSIVQRVSRSPPVEAASVRPSRTEHLAAVHARLTEGPALMGAPAFPVARAPAPDEPVEHVPSPVEPAEVDRATAPMSAPVETGPSRSTVRQAGEFPRYAPPPEPPPVARAHVVPGGAVRRRGEGRPPAIVPSPAAPRPKHDSSPTLTSVGVTAGPRQRHDPRVEPCVDVTTIESRT